MPFEASSSGFKIPALGICLVFFALPLLLGGCKGGNSDASSSAIPINTAAGLSDSPFISGDGRRLYFTYSRYDFGQWFISGGAQPPVPSGHARTPPPMEKRFGSPPTAPWATAARTSGFRPIRTEAGPLRQTWARRSIPPETKIGSGFPQAAPISIGTAPGESCIASPPARPARELPMP